MRNPLLDVEFLKKLDNQTEHEIYAKVISLDFDENPQEEITGRVTGGSVNIDGVSAVRRSCSVTMVAQEVNINDFYWGLNTKIKLYIGLKNFVDSKYDDIIWFKQGTYILDSFSTSYSVTDYTINLSGKDKMCLLNGDVGGTLTELTTDFGTYDQVDADGNVIRYDYPLKEIITEAVHHYAKEPYYNIIVNDLDDEGLELMEYRGSVDLYLLINEESTDVSNIHFDDGGIESKIFYTEDGKAVTLKDITYNSMITKFDTDAEEQTATRIRTEDDLNTWYTVEKVSYGDTCGYRLTDLVYAGELLGEIDNSITSAVLDKIVTMLGDYEYFYDVNGVFHFQRKRVWYNKSWNSIVSNESEDDYAENAAYTSANSYSFTDNNLISSFSNAPDYANLRNDYAIWGVKKVSNETEIPIHLRYAIDRKPSYYKAYDGTEYTSDSVDWREIIYQMAKDYYKYHHDDEFLSVVSENNMNYYPTGITGYEQYYIDMEGFWRLLYDPEKTEPINLKDFMNLDKGNTYYIWDEDSETFNEYTFREATSIIPVDSNTVYYYNTGLVTLSELILEVQEVSDELATVVYQRDEALAINTDELQKLQEELEFVTTQYIAAKKHDSRYYDTYIKKIKAKIFLLQQKNPDNYEELDEYQDLILQLDTIKAAKAEAEAAFQDESATYLEAKTELETSIVAKESEKVAIEEYYDVIITELTSILNEEQNGYIKKQFLELYDSENLQYNYDLAAELVKAFYSEYCQESKTRWRVYAPYCQYKTDETYYLYEFIKDLTTLSSDKKYYIQNEDESFEEYTKTIVIPDETSTKDALGEYTQTIEVPLFDVGQKYYQFKGFEKVSSLTAGNTYYGYYTFREADSYVAGQEYYILTEQTNENGDKIFEKKEVNINTTDISLQQLLITSYQLEHDDYENSDEYLELTQKLKELETLRDVTWQLILAENTLYIKLEESSLVKNGTVSGYVKILELEDKAYYSQTLLNDTLVTQTPKYYTRGITYYDPDTELVAFTFQNGVNYYLDTQYKEVLDLSELLPDQYYSEYSSEDEDESHPAATSSSLTLGKLYYIFNKQAPDTLTNSSYYIIENNEFVEIDLLKKFVRGKTYYTYGTDYEEVDPYDDYDSELTYYIYQYNEENGANYIDIKDIVEQVRDGNQILSSVQMNTLLSKYGIKAYESGNIYGLGQDYTFYVKKEQYWPVNYYEFAFYQKADEYKEDETYYLKNGSEYTLYEGEYDENKVYYIKLNNTDIQVYLTNEFNINTGWTVNLNDPENLIFWFDFLDVDQGTLSQYSVKAIGDRPKSVNDDTVKSIYYRDVPTIIFCGNDGIFSKVFINSELFNARNKEGDKRVYYEKDDDGNYSVAEEYTANKDYYRKLTAEDHQPGYTYINLNDTVDNLFSISAQGKSAFKLLDEYLYDYAYCTQSITLNTIPIYYLEPNTRIFVHDDNSGIDGEYLVSRMTIPLGHSGTMSVSATKAIDRMI